MPRRVTIFLEDETAAAIDTMLADMKEPGATPELALSAIVRDWLIGAGYLPDDDIEEDSPTEGEA